MIDAIILAGGLGTRLAGIFDGPKCLAPIAGKPIIERLIGLCADLNPARVVLALGHRSQEVRAHVFTRQWPFALLTCIDPEPQGTAVALRRALASVQTPVLVLNGDTLPLFDLTPLVEEAKRWDSLIAVQVDFDGAVRTRYCGAMIVGPKGAEAILASDFTNLNSFVWSRFTACHFVPGFLDIGTPEGFARAQQLTEEELCPSVSSD